MSWENWEKAAEKGPMSFLFKLVVSFTLLVVFIGVIGYGAGWFSEAGDVAQKQFGPSASLVKYEWFKDASNALEAKSKDITVYEERLKSLEKQYEGVARKDWAREDREAYNQQFAEIAGLKASFNRIVREYNSNSEKFNWSYANTEGNVPRTYQEK